MASKGQRANGSGGRCTGKSPWNGVRAIWRALDASSSLVIDRLKVRGARDRWHHKFARLSLWRARVRRQSILPTHIRSLARALATAFDECASGDMQAPTRTRSRTLTQTPSSPTHVVPPARNAHFGGRHLRTPTRLGKAAQVLKVCGSQRNAKPQILPHS